MLLTDEMPRSDSSAVTDLVVQRLSTEAAFADLRDEWNRLASDVPFRRWEWLEAWWRHLGGPDDELHLLCVRDATGHLVGLAPWYVQSTAMEGNVVRFLGSGLVCSEYLTILTADGCCDAVAERVADWMVDEADRTWDAIELDGVADDDPAVTAFMQRLESRNHSIHKTPGSSCWRIPLPDSWESYLKCLSKSRRERVRQLQRRQFDAGRAIVQRARSASDLQRGFDILVDLHQQRRQSLGQPGCFSQSAFESFLREAACRFFDLGRLRLQWIELQGRPVAVEIDFEGGNTLYHYQSGIDPALPRERPGWLGTSAALKSAVDDGYTHFDFLRGDESYKSHWRAEPVATLDVRVSGESTSSQVRHEVWRIQRSLKNWVKSRFRQAWSV